MNLAKFPRRGYVQAPTPLEALPRFSEALGGKVNVFIKRDDMLPGTAGGNKTRKLDFCMAVRCGRGRIPSLPAEPCSRTTAVSRWPGPSRKGWTATSFWKSGSRALQTRSVRKQLPFQLLGVKSISVVPADPT